MQMDNTVILGSGDLWAGQIILLSDSSPVELIKFFSFLTSILYLNFLVAFNSNLKSKVIG